MNISNTRQGYCHVYTGSGKGKTTAALGLCLRALGHGLRCKVYQFMKGNIEYGELAAAQRLAPDLAIEQCGRETFVSKANPDPVDVQLAVEALQRAHQDVISGVWDVIVLDEINVALDYSLVALDDVLAIMQAKPQHVELILTGRYAPEAIVLRSDLVTEMNEVKHYFHAGVMSRCGIDY